MGLVRLVDIVLKIVTMQVNFSPVFHSSDQLPSYNIFIKTCNFGQELVLYTHTSTCVIIPHVTEWNITYTSHRTKGLTVVCSLFTVNMYFLTVSQLLNSLNLIMYMNS